MVLRSGGRRFGWADMPHHADTIAALATPAGTSALAVVRVSGPDTAVLARRIFGETPPPRAVRRGDYRDRTGVLVDEVLFVFFAAPHSYTGEDSLEISCHGNPFIAQKILEDVFACGVRAAGPGEFTQRAFLNGRMDLSQAEAVMDVIHARSERALAAANQQLRGALGRRLSELVEGLLGVLARVEAYIDFPDEDLPADDRRLVAQEIDRIILENNRLIATSHYGELLRDGIKTVIIGAPNVGKSSLLNRLIGRDRALVSPEPGTTRDFIEERIVVGPHCLRLIDTAGFNPTPAPLEKLGIEKTFERAAEADIVLLVVDAEKLSLPLPEPLKSMAGSQATIMVLNKIDLLSADSASVPADAMQFVRVSALTGAGLSELEAEIVRMADSCHRDEDGEMIAINARHAQALSQARECLAEARQKLAGKDSIELLASDLRAALAAVGEICGRIDNERMLDQLFATFCIGK